MRPYRESAKPGPTTLNHHSYRTVVVVVVVGDYMGQNSHGLAAIAMVAMINLICFFLG